MLKDMDEGKGMVLELLQKLRHEMSGREGKNLHEMIKKKHPTISVEETHIEGGPKSLDEIPTPGNHPSAMAANEEEEGEGSPEEEALESPDYEKSETEGAMPEHHMSVHDKHEKPMVQEESKRKLKFGGRLY